MRAIIHNNLIRIEGLTSQAIDSIVNRFTVVDKSKIYQLHRMAKSRYFNEANYKLLQKESRFNLVNKIDSSTVEIPSGFFYMLTDMGISDIQDLRSDTGSSVPLPWSKQPYDLRPYQEDAVRLMVDNHRGLINLATGLGKTLLTVHAIKRIRKKALIVCPSTSTAEQFYDILCSSFGKQKIGFYGDGKKKINDITVGIAASISKNVDAFKDADLGLVVFDEVHHLAANTFFNISEGLGGVGKMFGLTATDYRSDGKDKMIFAGCGPVIIRHDVKWGISNGWLAKPAFVIRRVQTSGKSFDDKLKNYKVHVLNSFEMNRAIVADAQASLDAGKTVLILVDEVAHGQMLAELLELPFATGKDSKSQEYVNQLNAGKIKGLVGTDGKIAEGTDTQSVEVLIMANFMASKGPVIQAVGRGLRKQGSKTTCLIVDYIPEGCKMLERHAWLRVGYYKEITDKLKVV